MKTETVLDPRENRAAGTGPDHCKFPRETAVKISCVFLLFLIPAAMQIFGITCPIKFLTGISCAGCGMTRAWISVLHLQFKDAFYYHPLFFTVPAACVVFFLKKRISKKLYTAFFGVIIAAFIIVYLYRMLFGENDIVVFEPENNLICKIIHFIWED